MQEVTCLAVRRTLRVYKGMVPRPSEKRIATAISLKVQQRVTGLSVDTRKERPVSGKSRLVLVKFRG